VDEAQNDNLMISLDYLQPPPRPELIDKKVIDGHVIPNHVIFTSSATLDHPFETEAFEDNLKVTATFFTQNDGKSAKSKWRARGMASVFIFSLLFSLLSIPRSIRQVKYGHRRLEAYGGRGAG
jgi:hypothetical protein